MHVALLAVDIDLSGATGDVSHVKDLSVALAEAGCNVDLFVAKVALWNAPSTVSLHEVPGRRTFYTAFRVWSSLRREPPDVIYERRFSPKLSALVATLLRRPFFVEINGVAEVEMAIQGRTPNTSRLSRLARHRLRSLCFRRAFSVIAVADGIRAALLSQYHLAPERICVVPNGVNLDLFRPMPTREARERLGLDQNGAYIVFVGNLVPWQGLGTIIEAVSLVKSHIPRIQLLVVGDGQDRVVLEELVRQRRLTDQVRFVGRVDRMDVPLWISAADITVAPRTKGTRNLASPLKLREYLACGKPVVASLLGGQEPRPEDYDAGVTVDGEEPNEFANVFVRLLQDPNRREAMSHKARDFAVRDLSWDLVARRLMGMFASAASQE